MLWVFKKKIIVEVIKNNRPQIISLVKAKLKEITKKQERELQGARDFVWSIK